MNESAGTPLQGSIKVVHVTIVLQVRQVINRHLQAKLLLQLGSELCHRIFSAWNDVRLQHSCNYFLREMNSHFQLESTVPRHDAWILQRQFVKRFFMACSLSLLPSGRERHCS